MPPMPALGWDGLNPEMENRHRHMLLLDQQNNRRRLFTGVPHRHPFPGGIVGVGMGGGGFPGQGYHGKSS